MKERIRLSFQWNGKYVLTLFSLTTRRVNRSALSSSRQSVVSFHDEEDGDALQDRESSHWPDAGKSQVGLTVDQVEVATGLFPLLT